MNKEQQDLLNIIKIDPVRIAEAITGTNDMQDKGTAGLAFGLQMEKSKAMNELLTSIGDTTFSNKLSDYLRIVTAFGFHIIYQEDFVYKDKNEKMYVLWHDDLSILLKFDTYTSGDDEPSVNDGNFYYNWAPYGYDRKGLTSSGGFVSEKGASHISLFDKDFNPYYIPNYPARPEWDIDNGMTWEEYKNLCKPIEEEQNRLWEAAMADGKRMVWSGNHDCRVAIITNIKALFENGVFLKEWKECAFPWLTNHTDHKSVNVGSSFAIYYEKTKRIISAFPDNVKKAIGQYKS